MKVFIYKIFSEEYPKFYIGSTKKNYFKQRLYEHKCAFLSSKTRFHCSTKELFENVKDLGSIKIEVLEEIEFEEFDKKQLLEIENKYIKENKDFIVNKRLSKFDKDAYNERRREKRRLLKNELKKNIIIN
jgi:hypothetical protein